MMLSLSNILIKCGLLASCAHVVCAVQQLSGAAEVKQQLAENEYTLVACKSAMQMSGGC